MGNASDSSQAKSPGPSLKAMLVVLLAAAFVAGFNQGTMNIALPHVSEEYHVPLSWANWLTVGFTIVAGTAITTAAALQARLGLRRLLAFAFACLVAGSLLAAFAVDFWMLIAGRLVQAVLTGIMYPTATAVILKVIPLERHGRWLAADSGIIAVGMALGPMASGFMLTTFGLPSVFFMTAAIGLAMMVLCARFMRTVEPRSDVKVDVASILLAFFGLGASIYALGEIFRDPFTSSLVLAGGVLLVAVFVRRQARLAQPLLNLTPLKHPRFMVGELLVMLSFVAEISLSVLLPVYFEGYAQATAFMAGALMAAPVVVDGIAAQAGGRIFDKRGIWPLMTVGYVLVGAGVVGVLATTRADLAIWVTAAVSALTFAGIGLIVAPTKSADMAKLPKGLLSHAASINSVLVQIAGSIGSAVFVGVMSADIVHGTARGMSKAAAYAAGFDHTVVIAIAVLLVGLAISVVYSLKVRKPEKVPDTISGKPEKGTGA